MSCFLTLTNQYKKNKTLHKIKKGTPKLSTDNSENARGGKKGKANENKRTTATKILIA